MLLHSGWQHHPHMCVYIKHWQYITIHTTLCLEINTNVGILVVVSHPVHYKRLGDIPKMLTDSVKSLFKKNIYNLQQ